MTREAYLVAEHVVKRYAKHLALDDVSIQVHRGTVFGLLGPNGAGKTTLIRIINRITAPDSGKIYLDGKPFSTADVARIGYLPEERGLYRKMKVGEQAIYLARLKGVDKATATKRLREWFEKFDINDWWNKKVEELSKGMQQKVQFICTVIHDPDLLIFDEPFSGFDPVNAELLKREILALRDRGKTVIFSTHNMQSVEELCDDIALINHSKVVLSGQVSEVREQFGKGIINVILRCSTPLTDEELSAFVVREKKFEGDKQTLRIERNREQSNRSIIEALPTRCEIQLFEEEIPSMNDIFISTVEQQKEIVR
ncbi:ABC transporter ATP-binding protein [Porphyromonas miyakawae]|uniref:ABC transporter ATP-binding protein n=1 Tax=Porphyromonas miyakawae TaxID=3137470 RepID=A0ABQ0E1Z6_9PORP